MIYGRSLSDSDEAIQLYAKLLDCFASLAMTIRPFNLKLRADLA
jgi:hypothetical protein